MFKNSEDEPMIGDANARMRTEDANNNNGGAVDGGVHKVNSKQAKANNNLSRHRQGDLSKRPFFPFPDIDGANSPIFEFEPEHLGYGAGEMMSPPPSDVPGMSGVGVAGGADVGRASAATKTAPERTLENLLRGPETERTDDDFRWSGMETGRTSTADATFSYGSGFEFRNNVMQSWDGVGGSSPRMAGDRHPEAGTSSYPINNTFASTTEYAEFTPSTEYLMSGGDRSPPSEFSQFGSAATGSAPWGAASSSSAPPAFGGGAASSSSAPPAFGGGGGMH